MSKKTRSVIKNPLLMLGLLFVPTFSLASTGTDKISSVLSGLIDLLTSTPARLIFTVAIIGIGYGTLALGKIPKEKAIATVLGIGIVFSAAFIAQKMGMSG